MPAEVACGAAPSVRSFVAPQAWAVVKRRHSSHLLSVSKPESMCVPVFLFSLMMIAKLTNFRARLKTCTADNNFPVLLLNTTPYQSNNEKLGCSTLIVRVAALLMACILPTRAYPK